MGTWYLGSQVALGLLFDIWLSNVEMPTQSGKPPSSQRSCNFRRRGLKSTGTTTLSNRLLVQVWNPVVSGLVNPDWEFCIMPIEEAFPIPLLFSYIVVTVLQSYPLELFSIQLGNSLKICCWITLLDYFSSWPAVFLFLQHLLTDS